MRRNGRHQKDNGRYQKDLSRRLWSGALAQLLAAAPTAVSAQGGYPLPTSGSNYTAPPAAAQPAPQGPLLNAVGGGFHQSVDPNLRVVGGSPASRANWRSFALLRISNGNGVTTCGGAVIGKRWVLTAGHCVLGRSAGDFTVVEDIDQASDRGHQTHVDRVLLHESYTTTPTPRNDIALLHLDADASSPPQMLMGLASAASKARPGVMASLAGFGLTTPQPLSGGHTGSASKELREVSLPLVDRGVCARILGNIYTPAQLGPLDESVVCAGDTGGGRDACNGDSGGPLTVDVDSRRVQVGVVSWGPGCGLRDTVGVYTAVAYFEDWIRQRASDAIFLRSGENYANAAPSGPSVASPSTPAVAPMGEACGLPPLPANGGVQVALLEGSRVRIGEAVHVRALPSVSGQLLLFNVDLQTCRGYQLFPNAYASGAGVGAAVEAGASVMIPPSNSYVIRVGAPAGANRLYAMIVPPGVSIDDLATRGADMRSLSNLPALWSALAARARSARGGQPQIEAAGTANYEIVP